MRHQHTFTYEESALKNFTLDDNGLEQTVQYINQELNAKLSGQMISSSLYIDNLLFDQIQAGEESGQNRKNVVRAISEAIQYAVAKCYSPNNVWAGFT